MRYTFLRDNLYHRGLALITVGDDGVIRGPAGDGRVASVSHDDIADVATVVLLDADAHRHDGVTYDVTGPEALTLAEVAAEQSGPPGARSLTTRRPSTRRTPHATGYGAPRFEVDGVGVVVHGDRRG